MAIFSPKKQRLHPILSGTCLVFLLSLLCACRNEQGAASHPEYFTKVFHQADSINSTNSEAALRFVDSACNCFPNMGIKDLFKKYAFKGRIYEFHHQYAIANVYADSMLWVIRDHIAEKEYLKDYSNGLYAKGLVLQRENKYAMALEYYYKARQALENTNDACSLSDFTSMLGFIKYKQKKYVDATRFGLQAYHEALSCPDNHEKFCSIQGKLDNIGIYYTAAGMLDSGLYYYNAALDYITQTQIQLPDIASKRYIQMAQGIIHGNMGDVLYQKGDTLHAEELYKQSIEINTQKGFDHRDALLTIAKLTSLYINTGQLLKAQQSLGQFKTYLDSMPNKELELKWYSLQMQLNDKAGRKDLAYDYAKPYLKLKDSLNDAQHPQMDMDKEYELIKNHYDLIFMSKKNDQNTMYLLVTLVISILAIIIAFLLWFYWQRSRRSNANISKQNNEMQLAIGFLEESQQENTRMMKIVAHDLRNPVTSVISITTLLLENRDMPAEEKQMLELMKDSSEHSLDMIADLLNINTTAEGIKMEPTGLHTLLQYCIDMLRFKATDKKQRIILDTEHITLNINEDKMWRVFSNLVTNAIKFSPEQAIIKVSIRKEQDTVKISIQDHGIGIPDSIIGHIFDTFTNARRLGTSGEQSFGLGLSISRQIVEAHKGTLTVISEVGKGSTFTVTLPIS